MFFGESRDETLDCCYRGGKKHCFEARYNKDDTSTSISDCQMQFIAANTHSDDMADAHKSTKKTYIHDIRIWCGEINYI